MTVSMLAFLLLRGVLPALYSADPEVRQLATAILPIAAAFQLFDGTQAVGGGVLRGMGNTRPAALVNLVGYYALALPLAWWLTFPGGLGLVGIWWGLALGLAIVAGLLVVFILRTQPTPIAPRLAVK
jgi:multidrug resistance protein, MATE family